MSDDYPRTRFDLAAYVNRTRCEPRFVCRVVAGSDARAAHLIYRDDFAIA